MECFTADVSKRPLAAAGKEKVNVLLLTPDKTKYSLFIFITSPTPKSEPSATSILDADAYNSAANVEFAVLEYPI